jgi:nicotinamidase-related amidase
MRQNKTDKNIAILVDPQNDFVEEGSLAVPEGRKAMQDAAPQLAKMLREGRIDGLVITADAHGPKSQTFANTTDKEDCTMGELEGFPTTLWPVHCVRGTYGQQYADAVYEAFFDNVKWDAQKNLITTPILKPEFAGKIILFNKGMEDDKEYYGAFESIGGKKTALAETIEDKFGVPAEIVTCGLAYTHCVCDTTTQARKYFKDTKISVLTDLTRSIPDGVGGEDRTKARTDQKLKAANCAIISTQDFLKSHPPVNDNNATAKIAEKEAKAGALTQQATENKGNAKVALVGAFIPIAVGAILGAIIGPLYALLTLASLPLFGYSAHLQNKAGEGLEAAKKEKSEIRTLENQQTHGQATPSHLQDISTGTPAQKIG